MCRMHARTDTHRTSRHLELLSEIDEWSGPARPKLDHENGHQLAIIGKFPSYSIILILPELKEPQNLLCVKLNMHFCRAYLSKTLRYICQQRSRAGGCPLLAGRLTASLGLYQVNRVQGSKPSRHPALIHVTQLSAEHVANLTWDYRYLNYALYHYNLFVCDDPVLITNDVAKNTQLTTKQNITQGNVVTNVLVTWWHPPAGAPPLAWPCSYGSLEGGSWHHK